MAKVKVLFVCTGNICRSPTAEGVLRRKAEVLGCDGWIEADSAGIDGYHEGEAPTRMARRCAGERGYDLTPLRARRVRPDDFARFDLILAMDRGHLAWLHRQAPAGCAERVQLFLDYAADGAAAGKAARDVPDPYYGGEADYRRTLDLIDRAMDGVIERLKRDVP